LWQPRHVRDRVDRGRTPFHWFLVNAGEWKSLNQEHEFMAKSAGRNNASTSTKPPTRAKQPPEKKIGPFANGIGACIWLNRIETDQGPRFVRSITISPRRYYDRESDQWKDAGSFNPSDLPALLFALTKAQEFCYEAPLPGQSIAESATGQGPPPNEEIPF
jgi:hypothetical protein